MSQEVTIFSIFRGYIGVSPTMSGEVVSGLYIDQLPDITEDDIESLATSETDADQLWSEIEGRALRRFYSLIMRELNKTHQVKDQGKILCIVQELKAMLGFSLQYLLGAEVMHTRLHSSNINVYTNLDGHDRARELEQVFTQRATDELEDVISCYDIHSSACFDCENQPKPSDLITFVEPTI